MMSVTTQGRRGWRRAATQAELVAAAWDLVREEGLSGLTMRDLGARVGLTAQSIYAYFASKHEIYDAMFQEGYQAFIEAMDASAPDVGRVADDHDRRRVLASVTRCFFDFCTSDPVRYQLLFQRTIPGFVPSAESYDLAVQSYDRQRVRAAALGIVGPAYLDLVTVVPTGLTDQQISNDPGGDRWKVLIDRAVDMLIGAVTAKPERSAHGRRA